MILPPLSGERRQQLAHNVKESSEQTRVAFAISAATPTKKLTTKRRNLSSLRTRPNPPTTTSRNSSKNTKPPSTSSSPIKPKRSWKCEQSIALPYKTSDGIAGMCAGSMRGNCV